MDFLKTLLVYMTLISGLSVQEGPLPDTVPTPTPLPPTVTATLVPFQTEEPTPSPTPTPQPVPTIEPNYRYDTLRYQDSNNNVRKMQRRLIELGYLPVGADDGSFGYQTYNAVKDFQRANGLGADGVAGPSTLTNLYDNPAVLPKATPTPRPVPSAEPTLEPLPSLEPLTTLAVPAPTTQAPAAVQTGSLDLTAIDQPLIISGLTGETLSMTATVEGVSVRVRPHLWQNAAGDAVVSLHELTDCMSGWALGGSSVDGFYTLTAAGYTVELHCAADAVAVTVDGQAVAMDAGDVQLYGGVLYITDDFLETVFGATTSFDADERSLVILIMDKRLAN